ncbi:MAG: hypothetical protein N3A66_06610 [Planctomycetota bacterium]|nr:hypothetical protein [Planctomycetota bacterium]
MNIARWLSTSVLLFCAAGCGEPVFPPAYSKPRGQVETYRRLLAQRLLEKYNNLPDYAGQISQVELFVAQPPLRSVDGKEMRVEYDQIVRDKWGRRVPALEKEYFIVTFGPGAVRQVPVEPSLQIGLKQEEGLYSEQIPVTSGRVGALRGEKAAAENAAPQPRILSPLQRKEEAKPEADVPVAPAASEDDLPVRIADREIPRREALQAMAPAAGEERAPPRSAVAIPSEMAPLRPREE